MGFYKVIRMRIPKVLRNSIKLKKIKVFRIKGFKINKKYLKICTAIIILIVAVNAIKILKFGFKTYLTETIPFINNYKNVESEEYIKNNEYTESNNKTEELYSSELITYGNINKLDSFEKIKKHMYIVDESAYVTEDDLNLDRLLNMEVSTNINSKEPKVLIFHTHSQEAFKDSVDGNLDDTIVGVGQYLSEILSEEYGVSVVHDTGKYDVKDGKLDRGGSYETMEPYIRKILKKYPSIDVCIDLHRDGVPDNVRLVTEINDKQTAKIMFFNGICRLNNDGFPKSTDGLSNKYINDNMAFSFNMQTMCNTVYPGFTRKIYIKPYRYSLHMKPLSLLVEAGGNTNTVQEVKNAMEPLADVLYRVLSEK